MMPAKPLSEMTQEEILAEIRSSRIKRVAAKERATKPRGSRKLVNDMNVANLFEQLSKIGEDNGDAEA